MMPLRGRALWGAWLIALACHLGAGAEMSVVVVLGAGPDPQLALVGESVSAAVTATVADAPEPNAELQINGPVWAWSVGTPTVDGQPAAGATASVAGNGAAATVTLSSPVHGTVAVPVSVTCTYTAPATGQVWSASGGTSVSANFVELVDVLVSGATHKVYDDGTEVWGAPRRPDTEQAPAPKVTLTAVFEPGVGAEDAARFLGWSGGEAGADVLSRQVPTSTAGLFEVTATADKSITRTIKVAAWTAGEAPTVSIKTQVGFDDGAPGSCVVANPGDVVSLSLVDWQDADANEFAADEQDAPVMAGATWTVTLLTTDPDTGQEVQTPLPELTRQGATFAFTMPCGGSYSIDVKVDDAGNLADDTEKASISTTLTVGRPCNCGGA